MPVELPIVFTDIGELKFDIIGTLIVSSSGGGGGGGEELPYVDFADLFNGAVD